MRNNNFDFLRFYFAFIVVIGHLIVISGVSQFKDFSSYFDTYTSVTAFFIISGFLIAKSYSHSKSLKDYFRKRASRLLPAYLLVVSFSGLLLSLQSTYSFSDYFNNPNLYKYFLANFSFLNFIQPCLPGVFNENGVSCDVNGALWTLKVEVAYYLTIPIFFLLYNKTRKKIGLLISLYLLSVLYKNGLEFLSEYQNNEMYNVLARQLPGFISYFVVGISVYLYFDWYIKRKIPLLFVGLALIASDRLLGLELFLPIGMAMVIFAIAFSFNRLNSFAKYGDISYGIYVFHCPIIKLFTVWGLFSNYNPYLMATVAVLLVLIMGTFSWHFVEKKFLKR